MAGFKSEAQRKRLTQLHKEGKISKEVISGMHKDTGNKKLPERVKAPKKVEKPIANKVFTAKIIK